MILTKLINKMKPPCPKCPYTLGLVKFVKDPCITCKLENYEMYYTLTEGSTLPRSGRAPRQR